MRLFSKKNYKAVKASLMGIIFSLLLINVAFALPIVAGDDTFPSVGEIEITTLPNPFGIPIFNETIHLDSMGTFATVHRDEQVDDTIDTEIVRLDLFGTSMYVGPMHVRVGAGNAVPVAAGPSLGQILNVIQDPSDPGYPSGAPSSFLSGDSFFDVFFEIDVGGVTLFNVNPALLEALNITHIPPYGAEYQKIGPGIFIWVLGQDPSTDAPIGIVVKTSHIPTPEPTTMLLVGTGLIGFAGAVRRKKK